MKIELNNKQKTNLFSKYLAVILQPFPKQQTEKLSHKLRKEIKLVTLEELVHEIQKTLRVRKARVVDKIKRHSRNDLKRIQKNLYLISTRFRMRHVFRS